MTVFLIFTELTIDITLVAYLCYTIKFISYRTLINTAIIRQNKTVFTLSTLVTVRSGTFITSLMASIAFFCFFIIIIYAFFTLVLVRVILIPNFTFNTFSLVTIFTIFFTNDTLLIHYRTFTVILTNRFRIYIIVNLIAAVFTLAIFKFLRLIFTYFTLIL